MADIIETGEEILAFLDEDQSLNDLQKNDIKKNFRISRSQLAEYGILPGGKTYEFVNRPSTRNAVATTNRPLVPFMIALIPPDIYPGEQSRKVPISAPQSINIRPIKTKTANGNFNFDVERTDNRIQGSATETEVFSREFLDSGSYLTDLRERYQTFQKQSRKADRDLTESRRNIVANRQEVVDEFARNSREMQEARTLETNEEYLRRQILAMRNLPPLIMYVSPTEFSLSYDHIISDGNKGREGYIVEHWGLQQPTINASGKIGATYIDSQNQLGGKTGGLTQMHRRESAAYQSFMNLFRIYRNNAYIYNADNRISVIGSVKLFYDDTIYTGAFDSFTMEESEDDPFTVSYSFSFTVRFIDRISQTSERGRP